MPIRIYGTKFLQILWNRINSRKGVLSEVFNPRSSSDKQKAIPEGHPGESRKEDEGIQSYWTGRHMAQWG